MAGKKLRVNVTVSDPEGGDSKTYMAGEEVPADIAKLINAPGVWEGDEEDEEVTEVPGPSQFSVADEDEMAEKARHPGDVEKDKAAADKPKARTAPVPAPQTAK